MQSSVSKIEQNSLILRYMDLFEIVAITGLVARLPPEIAVVSVQ